MVGAALKELYKGWERDGVEEIRGIKFFPA